MARDFAQVLEQIETQCTVLLAGTAQPLLDLRGQHAALRFGQDIGLRGAVVAIDRQNTWHVSGIPRWSFWCMKVRILRNCTWSAAAKVGDASTAVVTNAGHCLAQYRDRYLFHMSLHLKASYLHVLGLGGLVKIGCK